MKHQFRGCRALLERDVQALRLQELDWYVRKFPLFAWRVMKFLKPVLTRCGREKTKRPLSTDGAFATNCGYIRLQ